jgi:putative nucleotidyltransferase with HDIG domain
MNLKKREIVLLLAGIVLFLLAVDFAGIKAGYVFIAAAAAVIVVAVSTGWVNGTMCGLFFNFAFYSMHTEAGIAGTAVNTAVFTAFAILADRIKLMPVTGIKTAQPAVEGKAFTDKITASFMLAHDMLIEMKNGISEDELFSLFAGNVSNLAGAQHVLVYTAEKTKENSMRLKHSHGMYSNLEIVCAVNDEKISGNYMRSTPAAGSEFIKGVMSGFVTAIPVKNGKGMAGAAIMYKNSDFSYSDIYIAEFFAAQVFIILEKQDLIKGMAANYGRIIEALAMAIDIKDHATHGHSMSTMKYAAQIAEKMKLPADEIEKIKCAAMLHDIGKIKVSTDILRKPSSLTPEEYETIKKHPRDGYLILSGMELFEDILPIVLYHHEHFDGKGYPDKLKGDKIPLGSRICSVADAYSVMLADRPYKNACTVDEAAAELKRCSGSQFDSRIVNVFLDVIEDEKTKGEYSASSRGLDN